MLEIKKVLIKTDFIKLGQFLKYINFVNSGGETKEVLKTIQIYCNGILENRKGKKLYPKDEINIGDIKYILVKE